MTWVDDGSVEAGVLGAAGGYWTGTAKTKLACLPL